MAKIPRMVLVSGFVLILAVGLIHAHDAKDSFEDAVYKGWLFYANGIGSIVAALGIMIGKRWGWSLGLLIAAGSFIGYVASRTIGLPMIPPEPENWLEPLGVASLIVEGLFIIVYSIMARSK